MLCMFDMLKSMAAIRKTKKLQHNKNMQLAKILGRHSSGNNLQNCFQLTQILMTGSGGADLEIL